MPSCGRPASTSTRELMGGDGTVPLLFFLRDGDGNRLMVVQAG